MLPTSDGLALIEISNYNYENSRDDINYFKIANNGELENIKITIKGDLINYYSFIDKDDNLIIILNEHLNGRVYSKVIKYDKSGNLIFNKLIDFECEEGYMAVLSSTIKDDNDEYIIFFIEGSYEDTILKKYSGIMTIDGDKIRIKRSDSFDVEDDFMRDQFPFFMNSKYIYFRNKYSYDSGPLYVFEVKRDIKVKEDIEHGNIILSKNKGYLGDEVSITVTPELGYELDKILVNNKAITGNKFKINGDDEVTATFKPLNINL